MLASLPIDLVASGIALVASAVAVAVSSSQWALEPGRGAYYRTGEGIRTKSIAFMNVRLYAISHEMKHLPQVRSKRAVVEMDTDKKLTLRMLRDIDVDKIRETLRDAYLMNGYTDVAKIRSFLGALTRDLKEGSYVTVVYDSEAKSTTITVQGAPSMTIEGVEFMKATWSIWFGKIDQPALADALMAKLP